MSVLRTGSEAVFTEVCRLPFIFGAFPHSHHPSTGFRPSWFIVFISTMLLAFHLYLGTRIVRNPSLFYTGSQLSYFVYIFQILAVRFTIIASVFWPLNKASVFSEIIALFSKIELFLALNGRFLRFRIAYINECLSLLLVLVIFSVHLNNRAVTPWHIGKNFTYYSLIYLHILVSLQFNRLVSFMVLTLSNLRRVLLSDLSVPRIEAVLQQVNNLYRASRLLNHLFDPQVFLIITSSFVITTANSFFVYHSLFLGQSPWENIIRASWVLVFAKIGYIVVKPCRRIANDEKLKLYIAMKREIVFTACGFFNLDYSLLGSMIASSTTYLVILIQFGDSSRSVSARSQHNSTALNVTTELTTLATILTTPAP